ncbi:hypothetical protein TWF132_006156 [Orbilia oligospora]|nr:hypothetical protein TWF132_006156 [Orbilia oligospora]
MKSLLVLTLALAASVTASPVASPNENGSGPPLTMPNSKSVAAPSVLLPIQTVLEHAITDISLLATHQKYVD